MKKIYIVIAVIAVILVGGIIIIAMSGPGPSRPASAPPPPPPPSPVPAATNTPPAGIATTTGLSGDRSSPTPAPAPRLPPSQPPAAQSFTIHADDAGADLTNLAVQQGTKVTITFAVSATGVYYGGLDFRSSVLNTGTIKPGESKTISFTADSSFTFTPYWPASNVKKPYLVAIQVK